MLAAAVSPDGRIVTLQRTPERLEFMARDSPNMFVQSTWRGKHAVTGFFWARAAACDFVMVTAAGLELHTLAADRQVCLLLQNVSQESQHIPLTHASQHHQLAMSLQSSAPLRSRFSRFCHYLVSVLGFSFRLLRNFSSEL